MRIDDLRIDGFGTLSDLHLQGLEQGVNVLYGANGSGKTTIVQFLRGMISGFGEAHRLRLLPPLKGGNAGGSLGVHHGSGRFEIIRQGRADHSDTLAIQLLRGTEEEAARLRQSLKAFPASLLNSVFFVSGPEAHDLPLLVRTALNDGISLATTRRTTDGLHDRMQRIERERSDLFTGAPAKGSLADLELRKTSLEQQLVQSRQAQAGQLDQWRSAVRQLEVRIAQLDDEIDWTHAELQAVEADLIETQTRLWDTQLQTVQELETVERPAIQETAPWFAELKQIDAEIAHAQQVLRDLAASRMKLSLTQATLAGAEVPDADVSFHRQRAALRAMEHQTELLQSNLTASATAACSCQSLKTELAVALTALRNQIWTICDELGRQQAAHEQWLCSTQRDGVDRCELELTRQIQRLRLRRDGLLQASGRSTQDRHQCRDHFSQGHCECLGHEHFLADLQEPVLETSRGPQVIVRERTVRVSAARPGDAQLAADLQTRREQLRQQWWRAQQKRRDAATELEALLADRSRIGNDTSVQQLRYEYACVEQQLADGREQWQSLALLQEILQRTRQKLEVETPAPVLQHASDMLRRMTDGRYLQIAFRATTQEVYVVNASGAELELNALSRGTLEQAALCFRLALCREYARRGVELPLVLDDVLSDTDETRLRVAVEVLLEFAAEHQLIVFTCQDHLMHEFEQRGIVIQNLPGSRRRAVAAAPVQPARTFAPRVAEPAVAVAAPLDRIQPDDPFWLSAQSPLHYLPSLGEQMARRLGALGVRTAGDLIDLDPETTDIPLSGLQISSATLRNWQAEARLLCCVPGLTGRDAQVLVLCGIQTPSELAEADIAVLGSRIATLRSSATGEHALNWMSTRPEWPSQDIVQAWVKNGRGARRWRRARDVGADRRMRLLQNSSARHSAPREHATRVVRAPELEARRQESRSAMTVETGRTYWLTRESDIVDAPSIGPRTAGRFYRIGVKTVGQFLQRTPDDMAAALEQRSITADTLREWQHQADLMCQVPELRGHDAQILVACGLTTANAICELTPAQLLSLVEPFATSKSGQRLIRSAKTPDLEEVTQWIDCARFAVMQRAA